MIHNSVNQYSKPWYCKILRDAFRDSCQCLRTSVDYLIFQITMQFCKFLDVTSVSPTPLRKYFPTVAAVVVFFGNNVRDSQSRATLQVSHLSRDMCHLSSLSMITTHHWDNDVKGCRSTLHSINTTCCCSWWKIWTGMFLTPENHK